MRIFNLSLLRCAHLSAIGLLLIQGTACHNISVTPHFKSTKTQEGRLLGTFALQTEEASGEHAPRMRLIKEKRAYALRANFDNNAKQKRKGDFVMMRHKDYRWFTGLQWRFTF